MTGATLVTGASGHVGAALVRLLVERGMRVRALVHADARALAGLDVEAVAGDVRSPEDVRRAADGVDTCFHLAARISIVGDRDGQVREVNVGGTRTVVDACRAAGVRRLVHCSSVHAFAPPGGAAPLDEGAPLAVAPGTPAYDRSKAEGHRLVLEAARDGLDAVIACPTAVLGPYDFKPSHTGRMLLALAHDRLPAVVDGGFDWVDVRDVAAGLLAAAERGRRGASYLLGGHWATVAELAGLAGRAGGFRPPAVAVPLGLARLGAPLALLWSRLRGTDPLFTPESLRALRTAPMVDSSRARRELGYDARPLAETVRDGIGWMARAGMLQRARSR
jgi:dihydroflavonol-4-reductase